MNWFKRLYIKGLPAPKSKHPIEKVFTDVDGIDYYGLVDINNLSVHRVAAAISRYEALRMRCTREFLLSHTEAIEACLNPPIGKSAKTATIDVNKARQLNDQLKERLSYIVEFDTLYELAACVYFDASENPDIYDAEYANIKIARWKRSPVTFFTSLPPIKSLIPSFDTHVTDSRSYLTTLKKALTMHLANHLSALSNGGKTNGTTEYLRKQMERLEALTI